MNWLELVDAAAERAGVSQRVAKDVLNAMTEIVVEELQKGESVSVRSLGRFEAAWRDGRTLRSIASGRMMMLGGRWSPRFKPSEPLRRALADRTPQHWKDPRHQEAWRTAEALVGDLALYHADRAPRGLTEDADLNTVHVACKLAFKNLWTQVLNTYEEQVPVEVREVRDYLGEAAREQWAS